MAEKKANRLANLVRSATDDLAAETPIRRGRGLQGLIAAEPELVIMSTSQQADNQTNQQADNQTSQQADKKTKAVTETRRVVRSYRIDDELAHRLDLLAAQERRKIYEVVEAAFVAYLRGRDGERT